MTTLDYSKGCVNFRDVGEFVNYISGREIIPQGRLFRGGKIDLVENHFQIGLAASIINLRKGADVEKFEARYYHFPISNDYEKYNTSDKNVRRWLNEVVKTFESQILAYPVLIHCTSGKDRTGVVVAAILKILEIPNKVIIEEYLLSEGEVRRQWIEQALAGLGDPREYFNRLENLDNIKNKFRQAL